jgi:hypothetical protein
MPVLEQRFTRNAAVVDQQAINKWPMTVIGCGAIGSLFCEYAAKLGVENVTLVDNDCVTEVNMSVQGFFEHEIGIPKVHAVSDRMLAINSSMTVNALPCLWTPENAAELACGKPSVIVCLVDSIAVRKQIFEVALLGRRNKVLLDARMAAESLQLFCTPWGDKRIIREYRESLFKADEAWSEGCTARSTIYCAAIAAGGLCSMFKRWAMADQTGFWTSRFDLDIRTMDVLQNTLEVAP